MITRKNFLLGTVGVAGVAACGDDGAGGAGGAATTTTTTSASTTKAASSSASSTKASGSTGSTTSAVSTSGNATSSTGGMMFTCASPENMIGTQHAVGAHELTVSAADAEAGVDKTYDITGQSLHMHSITVTAANWATLKATGTVSVTSTLGGMHTHVVTITCAA